MLLDSVVLLSISSFVERVPQFASVLLGQDDHVTESFEVDCDAASLPTIAADFEHLAQLRDPALRLLGFALINQPAAYEFDVPYVLHLNIGQTVKCTVSHNAQPDTLEIFDSRATQIANDDVFGDRSEFDRLQAKKVLLEKVRALRRELDSRPAEVVAKTGQLRKFFPGIMLPRRPSLARLVADMSTQGQAAERPVERLTPTKKRKRI